MPVGALEDGDLVPGPGQLLGGGQPGRAGADHRDLLARCAPRGGCGVDPALVPGPVDDLHLDLLDRDRVGVDAEHAGGLARRRAQPAGELGEVVGRVQPLDRLAPVVAGRPGRSTPGSGCPAGSRGGRTGCRSPCSGRPAAPAVGRERRRRPRASPGSGRRPAAAAARRASSESLGVARSMLQDHRPARSAMCGRHDGLGHVPALCARRPAGPSQHPLVVLRHDLAEPADSASSQSASSRGGHRRPGLRVVPRHDVAQERRVVARPAGRGRPSPG